MKNTVWIKRKCVPCEGGLAALPRKKALRYAKRLKDWFLSDDAKSIRVEYVMKDFMAAVQFIDRIASLAEKEDHHPDFHLTHYRKLVIELSTHAIGGLSDNDFILAAKIDRLPRKLKKTVARPL